MEEKEERRMEELQRTSEDLGEYSEPDVSPPSELEANVPHADATTEQIEETPEEEREEAKRIVVEEREVRGAQLMDTIERLLRESNVRRIRVKNKAGRVIIDVPAWAAAVGGAAALIALPILTAVSVVGGAIAGFKVEVEREVTEESTTA